MFKNPSPLFWPRTAFVASLCLLAFGLLVQPLGDPDVFIHLRDGRYLVENHLHVTTEPFSYTASGKPFETAEWLFRVSIYGAWLLGGYNLLIVLKSLIMTGALFLLGLLIHRRWPNLGVVGLLLWLAVLAPMARLFPERPYVFTYLFLPFCLLLLDDYRRAAPEVLKKAKWRLWLIPGLVIPWANLHPGFMVLFAFLLSQIAHDLVLWWQEHESQARERIITLSALTVACALAGAVNSMGFGLYTFTVSMMNSKEFMKYILEWAPPRWGEQPVFFILLGLAWLAQLLNWRKLKIYDFLPLAAFSYMAWKSYRNIPLFVIAAMPALAFNLRDLWERRFKGRGLSPAWLKRGLLGGALAGLLLLIMLGARGLVLQAGELPAFYPKNGLAWLEQHGFKGHLLTHDIWGGYTGWMTRGRVKIFMDGRLPTFGEKLYSDYRKMIWGDERECLWLLDRYQIQGLLVSPKNELRLFQRLWASQQWALVYWDDVCSLYVRRQGANEALARQFAYYAVDPKHVPFFNPEQPALALAETRRAKAEAKKSFLPYFFEGDLLLRMNELEPSRAVLEQVLKLSPGHLASLLNLGIIARRQNRYQEAEGYFRSVLAQRGDRSLYGIAAYQLALILSQDPNRKAEALRLAQTSKQAMPGWEPAEKLIQELQP